MWVSVDLAEQLSAGRVSVRHLYSDAVRAANSMSIQSETESGGQGDFHSKSS